MRMTSRTYPQPDLGHLAPRERAMALYKYLLGAEPEAAAVHPLFDLVVASYEAAEERGYDDGDPGNTDKDSLVDMLVTGATINIRGKDAK